MKLGQIFANVVADTQLPLGSDNLIELLILQLLPAERIVALDLSALLLVTVDLGKLEDLIAELASDPKGVYDLFHHPAGPSDSDVFVAARAVFVQLEPILNAPFAEQLVAIVALFGLPADFKAYLAQYESGELLGNLEASDAVGVIAHSS